MSEQHYTLFRPDLVEKGMDLVVHNSQYLTTWTPPQTGKSTYFRSFRPYREKDENGNFKSIKEAAMIYSFETFISIFIQEIEGKSYREAFVSLGNSDLIINVKGIEYLIEAKKYYSPRSFKKGKKQLAYYSNRKGIEESVYIVFISNEIQMEGVEEAKEIIDGVEVKTYLIRYDEATDFGET